MKRLFILISAVSTCVVSQAAIISVNVTDGGGGFGPAAANELAGVVEAPYWNTAFVNVSNVAAGLSGTDINNLVDDSGVGTSVSMSASGNWGRLFSAASNFNTATALFNNNMMTNWSDTASGSLTFSGIGYALYDVYVLSARPFDGQEAGFSLGGESRYIAFNPSSMAGPFQESLFTSQAAAESSRGVGNYVKFSGVSGSSFTIQALSVGNFMSVNGIQIVQVPEPSAVLLGSIVPLFLLRRRR